MDSRGRGDGTESSGSEVVLRRFSGPEADELFVVCRPERGTTDASRQAEGVYRRVGALLATEGASFDVLARETLFFRDIRADGKVVLEARGRVLGEAGLSSDRPPLTLIQQPPLGRAASFELSLSALIPRRPETWSKRDVRGTPRCPCEACSQVSARLVGLGDQTFLYTGNVHGSGAGAFDEAYDMFLSAEGLLKEAGMTFRDVVRTWIHLRNIDRDYVALNRARREFFRQRGIEVRPASTGVGGTPFPEAHDFSMSVYAVKSPRPLDVEPMSAPILGEAWLYGADFSRGLTVVEANKLAIYVAGTASVDEEGRTVHVNDFPSQAGRMLSNISSLLREQGASFRNVVSAVTYLKRSSDGPRLRAIYRKQGFDGFPSTLVVAPLCRPELLCETEVVAALPLPSAGR